MIDLRSHTRSRCRWRLPALTPILHKPDMRLPRLDPFAGVGATAFNLTLMTHACEKEWLRHAVPLEGAREGATVARGAVMQPRVEIAFVLPRRENLALKR